MSSAPVDGQSLLKWLGVDPAEYERTGFWLRTTRADEAVREVRVRALQAPDPIREQSAFDLRGARAARAPRGGWWRVDLLERPLASYGRVSFEEPFACSLDALRAPAGVSFPGYSIISTPGSVELFEAREPAMAEAPPALFAKSMRPWLAERHPAAPLLSSAARISHFKQAEEFGQPPLPLVFAPRAYARATGVGLLARLSTPEPPGVSSSDPDFLNRILTAESPAQMAIAWFASLPQAKQQAIEEASCERAEMLRRALEGFTDIGRVEVRRVQDALHRWVSVRDNLEAVAFLLGTEHARSDLGIALALLDEEGRAIVERSCRSLRDDARMRAIAWQEPELWWSRLGEGAEP